MSKRLMQVNLTYPAPDWGAAKSGWDRKINTPLTHLVGVLGGEHGRA
jgi:hypothetical protein